MNSDLVSVRFQFPHSAFLEFLFRSKLSRREGIRCLTSDLPQAVLSGDKVGIALRLHRAHVDVFIQTRRPKVLRQTRRQSSDTFGAAAQVSLQFYASVTSPVVAVQDWAKSFLQSMQRPWKRWPGTGRVACSVAVKRCFQKLPKAARRLFWRCVAPRSVGSWARLCFVSVLEM